MRPRHRVAHQENKRKQLVHITPVHTEKITYHEIWLILIASCYYLNIT